MAGQHLTRRADLSVVSTAHQDTEVLTEQKSLAVNDAILCMEITKGVDKHCRLSGGQLQRPTSPRIPFQHSPRPEVTALLSKQQADVSVPYRYTDKER